MLVAAVVGLGYLAARWAAKDDDVPATRGWRRWLPLAATVVVAGSCLAEIVSGSRAPDPVIVLWLASMVWVAAFLPLAAGVWGPARRALWAVGPAMTFAAIMFVGTQGFFWLRFARAVPDFDVLAQQVADGDHVSDGTHAAASWCTTSVSAVSAGTRGATLNSGSPDGTKKTPATSPTASVTRRATSSTSQATGGKSRTGHHRRTCKAPETSATRQICRYFAAMRRRVANRTAPCDILLRRDSRRSTASSRDYPGREISENSVACCAPTSRSRSPTQDR